MIYDDLAKIYLIQAIIMLVLAVVIISTIYKAIIHFLSFIVRRYNDILGSVICKQT